MNAKKIPVLALLCLLCLQISSCVDEPGQTTSSRTPLVVAVLPDQSDDALVARHGPLVDYLSKQTGFEIELTIPSNYSVMVDQFDSGEVDLAWFGGLTFIRAESRSNADPLVFRDIDLQFTSCYLARMDDDRRQVNEFEGSRFSFGPPLSTSGHLMPRYFLSMAELKPEDFFHSVRHADGHDQTVEWVSNGEIDLGVANCIIARSILEATPMDEVDVRIIETTPPYSNYVWAVPAGMDNEIRTSLLDAFLSLDATIPEHRNILRLEGANAYMPAAPGNFTLVRTAAAQAAKAQDNAKD